MCSKPRRVFYLEEQEPARKLWADLDGAGGDALEPLFARGLGGYIIGVILTDASTGAWCVHEEGASMSEEQKAREEEVFS